MDLFDNRIRLGVSTSHSLRNKSIVLNVYIFRILKMQQPNPTGRYYTESRTTTLDRLTYPVNRETCKDYNLLRPFEISNYHLVVISSANKHCHAVSQLNSLSAVYMHSMWGYVMSKDGRKISTTHLTLEAGVRHKERKMGYKRLLFESGGAGLGTSHSDLIPSYFSE